ncbi:MAG TPA: class I SAM-dependent methyltransferase [Planctomycetes bacterium]|nr:class I SAM-dependent methyltransferase [Planctomycetota bacterium]
MATQTKPRPKTAKTPKAAPKKAKDSGKRKAPVRRAKKKADPKPELTARKADKHLLYQWAVQSPEEDIRFLSRVYRNKRGKQPLHFREDFCGTALLCANWVKRGEEFTAEGFDICGDTIAWGVEHNFHPIGDAAQRVRLHMKDVREKSHKKPDLRAAQNFSYFVFKERAELLGYLKSAYKDLAKDGVFVLDIYGGPDSMMEMREEREIEEGFTYVWDQVAYWPATGEYKAHIHFEFPDGTEMKRAFTYDWRLWGLTEMIDALKDAGFAEVETFWEGTASDGESGNGIYRKSKRGENCEAWVTYIVAYK